METIVQCADCGSTLVEERTGDGYVKVMPCEPCMEQAKAEADEEGYARGKEENE